MSTRLGGLTLCRTDRPFVTKRAVMARAVINNIQHEGCDVNKAVKQLLHILSTYFCTHMSMLELLIIAWCEI